MMPLLDFNIMKKYDIPLTQMKHKISRYVYYILALTGVMHSCAKYERMTHLSDDELEWITNRQDGELMLFRAQDGTIDTAVVSGTEYRNSTNPYYIDYFHHGSDDEYLASAIVEFDFRSRMRQDSFLIDFPDWEPIGRYCFYIRKENSDEPICFCAFVWERWTFSTHLNDTCILFGGDTINDIVFFGEEFMEPVNNFNPPIPIVSLAWSKKYGLVQYSFQDGTQYNRVWPQAE